MISYPTRQGKLPQARMLARHGYGVLLLDARGYDGSEGDPNLFGWAGAKDIDAAVAWLQQRPDVKDGRIGGIGFSVGGEMMLQTAASNPGLPRCRVGGRRRALGPRGPHSRPTRMVRAPRGGSPGAGALTVMSGTRPPPALDDLVAQIAPRPLFLIYAGQGGGGRGAQPRLFPRRLSAQDLMEDRGGRACRWPRRSPARV